MQIWQSTITYHLKFSISKFSNNSYKITINETYNYKIILLYNFIFIFKLNKNHMDCTASISVSKSDCIQFRLYLFLSAHTHHKNIFYKFIEKVCERENFDYVRFVFIFYAIFIWMYRKKKKKKNEKGKKWKDRANDSNTRCPFLWHFCGNFGILVTPENELYHVIMVCWYKAVCRVIPCIPDLLTFDRE